VSIVGPRNNEHSRERDKGAKRSPGPRGEGLHRAKHDESPGDPLPPPHPVGRLRWPRLRSPAAPLSLRMVVGG